MSSRLSTSRARRVISWAIAGAWAVSLFVSFDSLADAPASDDLCGATIVADLDLDHDLLCMGPGAKYNGLTLGADGIRINLNGHTITGAGPSLPFSNFAVGIKAHEVNDVSIRGPGTVMRFLTGLIVTSSSSVEIRGLTVADNNYGITPLRTGLRVGGSSGVTIEKNRIEGSPFGVLVLGSTSTNVLIGKNEITGNEFGVQIQGTVAGVVVEKNRITRNHVGVVLAGSTTTDVTVADNEIADNDVGIRLNGAMTGNLVQKNKVAGNEVGIEFLGGPVGNVIRKNAITGNDCGVRGGTAGNTFEGNKFAKNGSDYC